MTIRPDDDRDFRQLGSGAFDRPVALNPTFESRLREKLTTKAPPAESHGSRMALAAPEPVSVSASVARRQPTTRSRWIRSLEPAAALLLVASLALGAIWFRPEIGQERDQRFAATTVGSTPTTSVSTERDAPLSWGGNNGHTFFTPDTAFDAESFATVAVGDDPRYLARTTQVSDGAIVQIGSFWEGEHGDAQIEAIWARDTWTGEMLWRVDQLYAAHFAIAGDTIYALRLANIVDQPYLELAALSLETGERRPFVQTRLPVLESGEAIGPVVVGDTVYVADSLGTTLALDAASGNVRWQSEGDRGSTPNPSQNHPGATGGALTATNHAILVVTGANQIRKLDPATGAILGEFDLAPMLDGEIWNVTLFAERGQLIARIGGAPSTDGDTDTYQMLPEAVAVLDPDSGDLRWSADFADIAAGVAGGIAITDGGIIVPERTAPADPIELQVFALDDGQLTATSEISNARTLEVTATGSSGDTLLILDSSGTLYISHLQGDQLTELQRFDTSSISGEFQTSAPVVSEGRAYVVGDAAQRTIVIAPSP